MRRIKIIKKNAKKNSIKQYKTGTKKERLLCNSYYSKINNTINLA